MRTAEQRQDPPWTIHDLLERACDALRRQPAPPADSRARALPDLRTLRYYLAQGLVSPPSEMHGRVGLYAERQLLELLAIKRLQAVGRSLAEIRELLTRASEPALREWSEPPVRPRERRRSASSELELGAGVRLVLDKPLRIRPRERRRIRRAASRLLREIRSQQRKERDER